MLKKFGQFIFRNYIAIIIIVLVSFIFILLGYIAEFSKWDFTMKQYIPNIFLNHFWQYMATPISALLIGLLITKQYNLKQLEITNQNRIDGASGWRKELMNISSKSEITPDDIHRIRSSLRYLPKDNKTLINNFFIKIKRINRFKPIKKPNGFYLRYNIAIDDHKFNDELICNYKAMFVELHELISSKKSNSYKKELIALEFDLITNLIIIFCDSFPRKFEPTEFTNKSARIFARYLLKHHWEHYINLTNLDNHESYISSMSSVSLDIIKEIEKTKTNFSPLAPHTNSN